MIYFANQPVTNLLSLSKRFQTILRMIDGGTDWLYWAMKNENMPECRVNDERELLLLIQQGLNIDNLIRFDNCCISLEKILGLSDEDVDQLELVHNHIVDNESAFNELLTRNKLVDYADMQAVRRFLQMHQLANNQLFACLSYGDMIALAVFVKQLPPVDDQVIEQALRFAGRYASVAVKFIDLVHFFTYASGNLFQDQSISDQEDAITKLYRELLPILYGLLYTTNIGQVVDESAVRKSLQNVIAMSGLIGYQTCEAAAIDLIKQLKLPEIDKVPLSEQVNRYMTAIREQLTRIPTGQGIFSQDGHLLIYEYKSEDVRIVIGASNNGNIFILPETQLNINHLNNKS